MKKNKFGGGVCVGRPYLFKFIKEGIAWEVLSYKMDLEEPEGAIVIAIALN